MASSDSGVESSAEVDVEMKDGGCRDEAAASPSDSSSDDVTATVHTSTHADVIVCGTCHTQFPLTHFTAFIDHKVCYHFLANTINNSFLHRIVLSCY